MAELKEASAVAPMTLSGKKWEVKAIAGDIQGTSAFYPASVLESSVNVFSDRKKIYLDHPGIEDKYNRPERSARDVIGYIENGRFDGKDIISEATIFSDWQEWVKERAEAGVIGMSIRAEGDLDESGTLKEFTKLHSIDLVTDAGAGGEFKSLLESKRETEEDFVMDEAMKAALDALVESGKQTAEAVGKLAEAEAKRQADAAAALEEANKPKELSATEVAAALVEAKLTAKAQTRVLAAVDAGTELAEAITAEKELAAEILAEAKNANEPNLNGNVLEEGGKTVSISSNVFGD